ncbi:MAG: ATP-binding cassette domain-containing protein [Gloeotrichia echinulata IR180]|jgi:putative ATP-binding cassette transporter|nr:ATP-binding cassette domain-containing protein [Gloeotrichia echinulata DEX184]
MPTQVVQAQPITNAFSDFTQFWAGVKAIAAPYWYPTKPSERAFSDVIRSWGMLILLILLIIALVGMTAFNSFVNRYLVDTLIQEKDYSKFINTLSVNIVVLVLVTLLVGFSKFVRKQIALDWYKWLNNQILDKYLSNRAYYKINFKADIDNPDQRLSQEIEPVTTNALNFSATFLEKVLEMGTFFIIIWSISQQIAVILLAYTIIGNFIAIYLNQELTKINQEELVFKADYNYSLTHVRNHAESIAFFQGETQESNIIGKRFNQIFKNTERKISWERGSDIFSRGYQSIIQIFPFLVLAPLYIRDEIDFGQLGQAALACNLFAIALGQLISEFGTYGQFSSYVDRLTEFSNALEALTKKPENVSTIKTVEENHLAFEHVTLQTPDYEQVIVEDLSLSVKAGEGLLIVGPSGRGKSSLLRAIAGLWNAGTGRLVRPPLEEVLFLPQRPYIILGTLREQLLYPSTNRQIPDAELKDILQQVNLQNLLIRVDGFDTEVPWENILSLGEQQRLAFARLLVTHPRFTILDEATSALDLKNEGNLYQQLQQTKTTFISVGHRESLFNYHQWVLELSQDSSWQLLTVQDYRRQKTKEIVTSPPDNAQILIDDFPHNESQSQSKKQLVTGTIEGLSHQEMQTLTDYSLSSIRSKASLGNSITAKDGFTYRYNKNPKVLKWVKV